MFGDALADLAKQSYICFALFELTTMWEYIWVDSNLIELYGIIFKLTTMSSIKWT